MIAGDVLDLGTHLKRLLDLDAYRPDECLHCHHRVLHGHDLRWRKPRRDPSVKEVAVRRYLCAGCGATWCILPGFLPRALWYAWTPIESELWPDDAPHPVDPGAPTEAGISPRAVVPVRTAQRWRGRLGSAARQLVQLLATVGGSLLDRLVAALGLDATRADLVIGYASTFEVGPARRMSTLAAHVHRVEPGLRLV